jgi:hypothetical protein
MDFSELASSLPTPAVADRGLLGALNGIGVRDASRTTVSEVSASQALLEAKRSAASEEAAVAAAPPSESVTAALAAKAAAAQDAASTPSAMLHASLVAGHRANMDEILARQEEVSLELNEQRSCIEIVFSTIFVHAVITLIIILRVHLSFE